MSVSRKTKLQAFAEELVSDPKYRANLRVQFREGTVDPKVEALVWAFASPKPAATVNMNHSDDREPLTKLTNQQLAERAEAAAARLKALPAHLDAQSAGPES